ncbi:MAG: hypothetical protein EZS28_018221 [Streblomastix strix]|uniref:Uncharacterized protein n=1 Tax=Streblomastix strix TaxID=222440 RepID=A0A5J4VV22_9EUKA|nr:MAG: hypothetical protein EZS28_018221 [Streblomastix strix]
MRQNHKRKLSFSDPFHVQKQLILKKYEEIEQDELKKEEEEWKKEKDREDEEKKRRIQIKQRRSLQLKGKQQVGNTNKDSNDVIPIPPRSPKQASLVQFKQLSIPRSTSPPSSSSSNKITQQQQQQQQQQLPIAPPPRILSPTLVTNQGKRKKGEKPDPPPPKPYLINARSVYTVDQSTKREKQPKHIDARNDDENEQVLTLEQTQMRPTDKKAAWRK